MINKTQLIEQLKELDVPDDTPVRVSVIEPALSGRGLERTSEGSAYEVSTELRGGRKVIYIKN